MKKHEFRKGDKVICVNNSCVGEYLILNQIYVVEYHICDKLDDMLGLVGTKEEFYSYRFELIQKAIVEYL
jgi:hypothetical protein